MAKLDDDLSHPRAMLRPCLFLLLAERPDHGYDLVERLRSLGFGSDGAGPLYQILRRLEADGLVESAWDASVAGPARRTYRLTAGGWATLRASAEALESLGRFLDDYRSRYLAAVDAAGRQAVPDQPARGQDSRGDWSGGPERQSDVVTAEPEAVREGDGRS